MLSEGNLHTSASIFINRVYKKVLCGMSLSAVTAQLAGKASMLVATMWLAVVSGCLPFVNYLLMPYLSVSQSGSSAEPRGVGAKSSPSVADVYVFYRTSSKQVNDLHISFQCIMQRICMHQHSCDTARERRLFLEVSLVTSLSYFLPPGSWEKQRFGGRWAVY